METTITVEHVVQKLKTLDHLNLETPGLTNFNVDQWEYITDELLNEFYPDNEFVNINIIDDKSLFSGLVWLNDSYKQKYIENLISIEFTKMYPNIICLLFYQGKIRFNNDRFGELYCYINENIDEFKQYTEIIKYINYWLNMTYGVYKNTTNRRYKCDNISGVIKYVRILMNNILDKFKSDIIYIDIDIIYLKDDSNVDNISKEIDRYKLPYNIYDVVDGLFLEKKCYINNGGEIIIGLIKMNGNTKKIEKYSNLINKFYPNICLNDRFEKWED